MVQAGQLIKAAEKEQTILEKLALLERALANLKEIIARHPSSNLAVKLVTDQPIGSLSLTKLTDRIETLKAEVSQVESTRAAREQAERKAEDRLHLAAVSKNTNLGSTKKCGAIRQRMVQLRPECRLSSGLGTTARTSP